MPSKKIKRRGLMKSAGDSLSPTTVFVGKKAAKVHRGSGRGTVVVKQIYSSGAPLETRTLYTVDAGSKTFGSDLQYVFERNVARARRENKKKFGVADPAAED